jgi:uracil-DNA glycosylase family protein
MAEAIVVDRAGGAAASIAQEAQKAERCTRCPLYRNATQVVFGEGSARAHVMLVGEQPGDKEDLAGHPFVGPAGRVLDEALESAKLDRSSIYLTNAVNHFKHELRGKKRLHKRPNRYEIERCRWWLDKELAIIRPRVVVALGATAAEALLDRPVSIGRERNKVLEFAGKQALITMHPSAILRMRESADRASAMKLLVRDLKHVRELAS